MKDPKNILAFFIPYLTICGVLYNLAFWETFGLNGLEHIDISKIIQSSIYPIYSSLFFIIILIYSRLEKHLVETVDINGTNIVFSKTWERNLFFIIWAIASTIIYQHDFMPFRWQAFSFVVSLMPTIQIFETKILIKTFPKNLSRLYIIFIVCFGISISYGSGKYQSELIFSNKKYKYIISNPSNLKSDTLKLIGSSDKDFFFTDINNRKTIIIKERMIDTLILFDK